jgi:peptidoglycan L-alanyl-D-glutamate endopeptidase CwlK
MLTDRCRDRLRGVHPDLVRVVERAAESGHTFIVTEGLRTLAQQQRLVTAGASQTLRSRHLTGHAVDLAVLLDGEVSWHWPLYQRLSLGMKAAAQLEGVRIVWGGDWTTFKDGPHFELDRRSYP